MGRRRLIVVGPLINVPQARASGVGFNIVDGPWHGHSNGPLFMPGVRLEHSRWRRRRGHIASESSEARTRTLERPLSKMPAQA